MKELELTNEELLIVANHLKNNLEIYLVSNKISSRCYYYGMYYRPHLEEYQIITFKTDKLGTIELYNGYIQIKDIIHRGYSGDVSKILNEVYEKAYSYLKAAKDAKSIIDIKNKLKDL